MLLPLTLCIGGGLALLGWRRGALAWCAAIGATLAMMLLLKLAFLGCAPQRATSPSGHTAAGTAVYGGLAALWLRRRLGARTAGLLAAGTVAAVIGTTRIALGVHTGFEVVLGALAGGAGVALLLRLAGPAPDRLYGRRLAVVALPLIVTLHGIRLPVEPHLRQAANWLPGALCGIAKGSMIGRTPVAAGAKPGVT